LYNLSEDPSEKYNYAADHPDVLADIDRLKSEHSAGVVPVTCELDKI